MLIPCWVFPFLCGGRRDYSVVSNNNNHSYYCGNTSVVRLVRKSKKGFLFFFWGKWASRFMVGQIAGHFPRMGILKMWQGHGYFPQINWGIFHRHTIPSSMAVGYITPLIYLLERCHDIWQRRRQNFCAVHAEPIACTQCADSCRKMRLALFA